MPAVRQKRPVVREHDSGARSNQGGPSETVLLHTRPMLLKAFDFCRFQRHGDSLTTAESHGGRVFACISVREVRQKMAILGSAWIGSSAVVQIWHVTFS